MPGKKAHHPRDRKAAGTHDVHPIPGKGRKSSAQTEGQFSRDRKGRRGQYGAAGNSPLIEK